MVKNNGSRKRDRWDSSSEEEEEEEENDSQGYSKIHQEVTTTESVKNSLLEKVTLSSDHRLVNVPIKMCDNDFTTVDERNNHNKNSIQSKDTHNDPKSSLRLHNPLLHGCRSVYDCYERLARLDEGTYGVVWKARDTATNEIVALKQIKFDDAIMQEGFPIAALREIGVLLALNHECIVTVREMVVGEAFDKVFMVMEYMDMDLKEAMASTTSSSSSDSKEDNMVFQPFSQPELKHMLYQILSATQHIHERWYLHRDMKTSNILVHKKSGKVALCDFGLARKYQMPLKAMTQMVITLWYRPPELLFGETVYGPEVDMWSIGCIFGELVTKKAMFQGCGELDQIDKIFKMLGVPDDKSWPEFSSLPNSRTFRWRSKEGSKLAKHYFSVGSSFSGNQTVLDSNGFDLLQRLLTMNPRERISANDALHHPYFKTGAERKAPYFP